MLRRHRGPGKGKHILLQQGAHLKNLPFAYEMNTRRGGEEEEEEGGGGEWGGGAEWGGGTKIGEAVVFVCPFSLVSLFLQHTIYLSIHLSIYVDVYLSPFLSFSYLPDHQETQCGSASGLSSCCPYWQCIARFARLWLQYPLKCDTLQRAALAAIPSPISSLRFAAGRFGRGIARQGAIPEKHKAMDYSYTMAPLEF